MVVFNYSSIYNSGKNEARVLMNRKIFSVFLSLIGLTSLLAGCSSAVKTTTFVEPTIPADFATYTDEQGLFSISYPDDWEPITSLAQDASDVVKDIIKSNDDEIPIEKVTTVFAAAKVTELGKYEPSVSILIEPMPLLVRSHDQLVEAEMNSIKTLVKDYHEISRTKTKVDGRDATIIEWEGTYSEIGPIHPFQMCILVGRNAWSLTCSAPKGESDTWRSDFNSVVRSLRILK
jgi:hypothetical protein